MDDVDDVDLLDKVETHDLGPKVGAAAEPISRPGTPQLSLATVVYLFGARAAPLVPLFFAPER